MCSFLFTNKEKFNFDYVNFFLQKRGPDKTNIVERDGNFYCHNLLSITGDFTPQPLYSNDLILLYNGEIYNYTEFGEFKSDGYCILYLYETYGIDGLKKLDGEFAIFIHDIRNNKIILCSDTFGTKPIYYTFSDKHIGVSSYLEPLKILGFNEFKKIPPNTIITVDTTNFNNNSQYELYKFDLNQHKQTYDDWIKSFEISVSKRVKNINHRFVVPMSGGMDSGSICCVLNDLGIDYISSTVLGKENPEIINKRLSFNKNGVKEYITNLSDSEVYNIKKEMTNITHPFYYGPNPETLIHDGFNDVGAIGLFYVLKSTKEKYSIKISISGQGADEIMSNIQTYGFNTSNPPYFTNDLYSIFPWGNFYYGSQWSYLMKEECIAGSLGIETRYPFLDRQLVQEYLWLSPDLKNNGYKAPLREYLLRKGYPFTENKMGFNINL